MTDLRTIAVVTGCRADFGLLKPLMWAVEHHDGLSLRVLVTGTHLLPPVRTVDEVTATFVAAHKIGMQQPGESDRFDDAAALGLGIHGFAEYLRENPVDVVLVLGDRIEAFAAAAAASIAGVRVAHMHGGDRAEGVADEAMRHAITKLAHIHLPATKTSAERITKMGEDPQRVHIVGSPAIDGLDEIPPLADADYETLGSPEIVFLLHPTGRDDVEEHTDAALLMDLCRRSGRLAVLHPNFDPGRKGVLLAIQEAPEQPGIPHLDRDRFIGLLRRAKAIVGNSSAGLIECAALPTWSVNIGSRQNGREKPVNVLDFPIWDWVQIESALVRALAEPPPPLDHPYGDGRAGPRTAEVLATFDSDKHGLAKHNTY